MRYEIYATHDQNNKIELLFNTTANILTRKYCHFLQSKEITETKLKVI